MPTASSLPVISDPDSFIKDWFHRSNESHALVPTIRPAPLCRMVPLLRLPLRELGHRNVFRRTGVVEILAVKEQCCSIGVERGFLCFPDLVPHEVDFLPREPIGSADVSEQLCAKLTGALDLFPLDTWLIPTVIGAISDMARVFQDAKPGELRAQHREHYKGRFGLVPPIPRDVTHWKKRKVNKCFGTRPINVD
jgi:hypothetical protein